MSRTIPLWACVINRTCFRLSHDGERSEEDEERSRWTQLRMPYWVGGSERAQIERKLSSFVEQLLLRQVLHLHQMI